MVGPSFMMVPAPMKPIPTMTFAAMRVGSPPMVSAAYRETHITTVAPRTIRMWVRRPAGLWVTSRCQPINPPSSIARRIFTRMSTAQGSVVTPHPSGTASRPSFQLLHVPDELVEGLAAMAHGALLIVRHLGEGLGSGGIVEDGVVAETGASLRREC